LRAIAILEHRWKLIRRLRSRDAFRSRAGDRASKEFWISAVFSTGYLLAAAASLWQWGQPRPWARFDLFVIGFFAVSVVTLLCTIRFARTVLRSREVMNEFAGITYDRYLVPTVTALALLELGIYLDYAHWQLWPALAQPILQTAGLVLYAGSAVLFRRTDRRLHRRFAGYPEQSALIIDGPFRFIRHPRHASLIASRFAMALLFASAVGWAVALAWLMLFVRRIRLEEQHLRKIFGGEYEAYARRTARLIPGIY